ncbi:hypothetical protein [Desulfoscipio gibsoniae]|uniref:Uncharacterized protein n=1 Tax=Desulfoscipio gibsoniae DSM 7213 TaxID=767817 RepID=R4KJW1_9FIRM|nr:hypothetical protein [Desulfoscipio gibsoniae]AGL03483.1 hypothetical protein Desgi_4232 [Desulfoscipio gibsoniae DSM 7213]
MEDKIQQLYELLFSPILTPHNLVDNVKLDNYEYVNYSKHNDGILVSMKCQLDKQTQAIFYYYFDFNDNLQKVIMKTSEYEEVIFNRQLETSNLISRIKGMQQNKTLKSAI